MKSDELESAVAPSRTLFSQVMPILAVHGQLPHFYEHELRPTLKALEAFVSVDTFVIHMIGRQIKYVVESISRGAVVPKLFRFELPPVVDPVIHEVYANVRRLSYDLLASCSIFNASNVDEIEERMRSRLEDANTFHFVDDAERMEANLENLAATEPQASFTALRHNPRNDVFLSIAFAHLGESQSIILDLFPNHSLPFKWSQLFSEGHGATFFRSIHEAFGIGIVAHTPDLTPDLTVRSLRAFLEILFHLSESKEMQTIRDRRAIEISIANFLRGTGPSPTIEPSRVAALDKWRPAHRLLGSFSLYPLIPPLSDTPPATTVLLTAHLRSDTKEFLSLFLLLSSGIRVPYVFSPFPLMETRWTLLSNLITALLKRAPWNHSKGQQLLAIPSVTLPNGFVLSQTSGEPLANVACLRDLVQAFEAVTNGGVLPEPHHQYRSICESKRDFCDWFWHFGVCFGGLAAVQLALKIDCPNPLSVIIDEKSANMQLCGLEESKSHEEYAFPRMCGKIQTYLDGRAIAGTVQRGMITAGNCMDAWKRRFSLYHQSLFGQDVQTVERFAILKRDVGEVYRDIEDVLHLASECQNVFVIPWI
jgi:hypothetical protein